MDFTLSKEHEMLRKMYREFAQNEVKPLAQEIDEEERFPSETIPKLAKLGLLGIPFPKKYGGAGGDNLAYAMAVEEIAKTCGTTSVIICAHTSLCCYPIYAYGTEEQKMKYLPDLLSGRKLGAFGLTEPNAGSDASGQQTIAVLEGDHYVLNGTKCFITNATEADTFVVFAMTDRTRGNHGISAFIVEKGFKGFSIGKHEKKMGINGYPTCDLVLEDVRVSKDCLVGPLHKGFQIAMKTLDGGRLGIAAQSVGIAQSALDEAVKYAKERKQFGRRIADFQGISFMLADMAADVEAARQLVYHAAVLKDANSPEASSACSIAKYFAAEAANRCAYKAVQIHGGYGYIREYKVERIYRDARITTIYEGTSQVQQMVIAGNLLK